MRVCPSSIVSVSSLLRSVATCSWHFPFFEYVVIAVQYLRTSHGPGEKDRAITRSDAVGVVNRGFPRSHAIQRQTPRQTAA